MNEVCACGCGEVLSARSVARGWKYVRGHKPKAGGSGAPVGDDQRRAPKAVTLRTVSYESTLAMVEENLAAVKARKLEIEDEIQTMLDEMGQMNRQLDAVTKDQAELEELRAALAPFVTLFPGVSVEVEEEMVADGQAE